ncbi:hypothetical protein [Lacisediminihabitans sp.]|uniref:hypothetical protein n=1 Tax=Lacisediminihabitans sp. TaxID=2787631 RepID=UPI002F9557FD
MSDPVTSREQPNVPLQGRPNQCGRPPGQLHRPATRTASVEMIALSSLFVYGVLTLVLLLTGFMSWTLIVTLVLCKRAFTSLLAWSDQATLASRGATLAGLNPAWAALSPMAYLWLRTRRATPDFSERHRPTLVYLACLVFGFAGFSAILALWSALPRP